jgi:hypothetical protein
MKIHASMSPGGGGDRSEGLGRPLAGFRRGWRPPLSRGQAWRGRGLKRPWTGRCERRARALFLNVLNVYHRSAHF